MRPREQDGGTQKHPAAQGRSRGINQPNSKTRFIEPCCHKNRMQAPNSTQQHQTEVEVETSLIEKLDYWTIPPGEQDGGTQHHPAVPGRSRGRNQPNSKTRWLDHAAARKQLAAPGRSRGRKQPNSKTRWLDHVAARTGRRHPAAPGRSRGRNQPNSKTRFLDHAATRNRTEAPSSTRQKQR